jgi:hypothetical protein
LRRSRVFDDRINCGWTASTSPLTKGLGMDGLDWAGECGIGRLGPRPEGGERCPRCGRIIVIFPTMKTGIPWLDGE